MNEQPSDRPLPNAGANGGPDAAGTAVPRAQPDKPMGHSRSGRPTGPQLTSAVRHAARTRFHADQDDAEYVEYTEAMARIGSRRRWRRERRRFLEARELPIGNGTDNELRSLLAGD